MTCLGVLDRRKRDKYNETGLKEGRGIEMSNTVLPLRDARSLRLTTYQVFFCRTLVEPKLMTFPVAEECNSQVPHVPTVVISCVVEPCVRFKEDDEVYEAELVFEEVS